jgi:hypothetical protein
MHTTIFEDGVFLVLCLSGAVGCIVPRDSPAADAAGAPAQPDSPPAMFRPDAAQQPAPRDGAPSGDMGERPPAGPADGSAPAAPTCNAGARTCPDRVCRPNDIAACGPSCLSCPSLPNGTATCDGNRCGFTCRAGFQTCQAECLTMAAGVCCTDSDCPAQPSATASCLGHACSFRCNIDAIACGDTCLPTAQAACCGVDQTLDVDGNGTPDCRENLIGAGDFKKDVGAWRPLTDLFGRVEWSSMDARGAADSGSIEVTGISSEITPVAGVAVVYNIPIKGGTTYQLYVDYFIPSGQVATGLATFGFITDNQNQVLTLGRQVGVWTRTHLALPTQPGATILDPQLEAFREMGTTPFVVLFDNVLLRE